MKVLYDHQIFSMQEYGGISRYFSQLMGEFERTGKVSFSVSTLCSNNQYLQHLKSFHSLRRCRDKLNPFQALLTKICYGQNPYRKNLEHSRQALMRTDFDVFHPTYYDPYFLDLEKERPFVLTIHDMIYEIFPEYFPVSDTTASRKRKLIEAADSIICVSEKTRTDLLEFFPDLDTSSVQVIHHGNPLNLTISLETIQEKQGTSKERKQLLYVGDRWAYKNFNFFITASIKILRKYPWLDIACVGGGKLSADEIRYLQQLDVLKRVRHYPVNDDQLVTHYRNSLALVIPSLYEGFGMPVLEAFACGCPVICSNSGSLPEIAQDAAVFFDPKSIVSIQNAVESVISNDDLRGVMVKKGLIILKNYSWARAADLTENVYKKTAAL